MSIYTLKCVNWKTEVQHFFIFWCMISVNLATPVRIVQLEKVEIHFHEHNISEVFAKDGIVVSRADVLEIRKHNLEQFNGERFFSLVNLLDSGKMVEMEADAQQLTSSAEFAKQMYAKAICVKSLGFRLIVNRYLKFFRPKVETKVFNSREAAVQWFISKMTDHN